MRSAMRAASQLSRRGGPLMWMLPLYLHVNQKSDYDDDESAKHLLCRFEKLSNCFQDKYMVIKSWLLRVIMYKWVMCQ